ncbi:MAG: serine/threonine-protein phosphatase [Actinobacteria bacterium]|nr:serine/threonine-protein phosphatase [Actinomycetota bacterium]
MDAEQRVEGEDRAEMSGFAGYRIVEFSQVGEDALQEVAERLIPHEEDIVDGWIRRQYSVWKPPGFSREDLRQVFGGLFHNMLQCMRAREPASCIGNLEEAGADLARQNFPYEALIISLHFLEESYLQFLLDPPSKKTLEWLIWMDEFLHAALAAIATSYFQVYRKELLEEAEVGQVVQEGLLPDMPKRVADLEVAYIYLSARERAKVGGDIIDLLVLDQQKAAFIVGDLSGHGLEASTDAAMLRFLFRGFMHESPDLTEAMARLNRVLKSELEIGHFATALAGIYEAPGRLKLVSAGHPPPVLCDSECRMLEPDGIALAIDEESTYTVSEVVLEAGAFLVAYTDGLIEARSSDGFFGESRVIDAVAGMRDAPARAVAEHLRDEALRYTGGKLMDDVAILVLKRPAQGRQQYSS